MPAEKVNTVISAAIGLERIRSPYTRQLRIKKGLKNNASASFYLYFCI